MRNQWQQGVERFTVSGNQDEVRSYKRIEYTFSVVCIDQYTSTLVGDDGVTEERGTYL